MLETTKAAPPWQRYGRDSSPTPPYGRDELRKINIHIPVVNAIAVHTGSVTEINLGRSNKDGQFSRSLSLAGNTTVNHRDSDEIKPILPGLTLRVYRALTLTER